MKLSRRWVVALALTLLASAGGAALSSTALHGSSGVGTSAGGSWYRVDDGMTPAAS